MAKPFSELRERMTPERQKDNERKAGELLAAMPLQELRKALSLTQEQLAEELGISQAAVSKMENRPDVYIRTLARFVEAMGGTLQVTANFPQGSVCITDW
jgi:DNA-binding XRE family transcriptional regulator